MNGYLAVLNPSPHKRKEGLCISYYDLTGWAVILIESV